MGKDRVFGRLHQSLHYFTKERWNSLVVQQRLAESVAKKLNGTRIHSEGARSSTTQYRDELAQIKDGIRDKTIKTYGFKTASNLSMT